MNAKEQGSDHDLVYSWATEAYRVLKQQRPHREPHLSEIAKQILAYHRPTTAGGKRVRDVASIQRELEGRDGSMRGLPAVPAWEKPK